MATDSRTRMISFRLSDEEYNEIRHLCFTRGIASVSEMARAALAWMLQQSQTNSYDCLEARVAQIEERLNALSAGETH